MEVFISVLLLLIGMVLIIRGGDAFVDAAGWMAEVSGIPRLIVGATVVSVATTLPELLVSVFAASEGKVDMAIGNAVGSVTANVGLIMAIALIFIPIAVRRRDYMLKSLLMLGAAVFLLLASLGGKVGLVPALLLLAIFVAFEWENVCVARAGIKAARSAADDGDSTRRLLTGRRTVIINIVKFLLGAVAMVIGARLLVDHGSALAAFCGVPERIISVTLLAVGTSLPELVTTVTAIVKRQGTLSIGNIIGANIIDLTLILPLCAAVSGGALPVTQQVSVIDLPACLLISGIGVVPTLITGKFSRLQGFLLLAAYIAYLFITISVMG